MTTATTLLIRTTDGVEHEFAMPADLTDGTEYTMTSRFEKLLTQRSIALAIEDRLLIIPMEQIRSIEISPIRGKLPGVVPRVTPIWTSLTAADADVSDIPVRKRSA